MQNFVQNLLQKQHWSIALPVFILIGGITGFAHFMIPLIAALTFGTIAVFTAKTATEARISIFIILAIFSGILANQVISVEYGVMVGMLIIASCIFLVYKFKGPAVASSGLLSLMTFVYCAITYSSLIIPTTLVAVMAIFSTYLMRQEAHILEETRLKRDSIWHQ